MNTKKIKQYIQNLMKHKNINSLIIILLVVILIYFIVSYFYDVNNISNSKKVISQTLASEVEDKNKEDNEETKDYEKSQQKSLQNILKQIHGVGNVEVKINFDGSEVKVPAVENNNQKSTTEETDNEGGKRKSEQETEGGKVVMANNGNSNEPFILKTDKPRITGVVVVAEGANDSKIKYEITKAVSSLYDISIDKVNVFPMKQ